MTFLLTDIEDSSTQWEDAPLEMRRALAVHDQIVAEVIEAGGGAIIKHMGDGCWAAFRSAPAAAHAAIAVHRMLQQQAPAVRDRLRVRIGLHTGDVEPTENDYFGPVPNRSARVADLANGDQIVCSAATAGLLPGFDLRSEGPQMLRGIGVEEVFRLRADGVDSDPRPLRRSTPPTNLPSVRTSMLGRAGDVRDAVSLIERGHRVVTLIGPGGVGKTRLAIEIGQQVAATSERSVRFCSLAPVADADAVLASVADQIGARQQAGMDLLTSIADFVSERDMLLVFDNCEHVAVAVAAIVERLADAPGIAVLATSRAALGVGGERLLAVAPLPPETVGVELFVDRATQHDMTFALTAANEPAVRELVERLDGIPLAIEVAAARIRLMTPQELVTGLGDGSPPATAGLDPTADVLRDTVQWSYRLLAPPQAAVFARLSVFAGGATLSDIAAVCTDDDVSAAEIPQVVLALVDQSMVVSSLEGGHRRFSLLETMRRFAAEKLGGGGRQGHYRERHAERFFTIAQRESERLFTAAEPDAWRVLDNEWDNLRVAVDAFAAAGDVERRAELLESLAWYATFAMRSELFTWAADLLAAPEIETNPRYTDLCGIAALGAYLTVTGQVTELAEAGLRANPDDPGGFCRMALAAVFLNSTFTRAASEELTSAWLAAPPATVGSRLWAEAFRTFHLATYGVEVGAREHAAATSTIARETGSVSARALAAWAQGMAVAIRDADTAITIWSEGLEWPRSMPRDHLVEHLLDGLILHFTVERVDVTDALRHCRAAVLVALDQHYYVGASHLFGVTAIALTRGGDAETGARLVGSMIGHGHRPRANARHALESALGDRLDVHQAAGMHLSVTQAGHIAIDALDAAMARVGAERAS
ncbi:MAG: adenylate/guanylate cyclase domain-containing protein [Ilumatobacter sp.]|nr:adenylate/guanylate cyclase domain-containing protein [Ilumatobacter sp.]